MAANNGRHLPDYHNQSGHRLFPKKTLSGHGLVLYLGTLTPVIGIIQGGLWPQIAERWAYVPFVGVFMLLAWEFRIWQDDSDGIGGLPRSLGLL